MYNSERKSWTLVNVTLIFCPLVSVRTFSTNIWSPSHACQSKKGYDGQQIGLFRTQLHVAEISTVPRLQLQQRNGGGKQKHDLETVWRHRRHHSHSIPIPIPLSLPPSLSLFLSFACSGLVSLFPVWPGLLFLFPLFQDLLIVHTSGTNCEKSNRTAISREECSS